MNRIYWRDVKNPRVILKQRICLAITVFLLAIIKLDGSVFATIDTSKTATLTMQNQSTAINVVPTDWSQDKYVSTMRTLTVTTTGGLSEYKVYANIPSSDTSGGTLLLVGGGSSSPSISQINATPSTATTLGSDNWGFGIPSGTVGLPTNNFSNSYTAGTPSTSSTYAKYDVGPSYTLIRSVTNASSSESFSLYYGARLGTDVLTHPGTYQTNVEYHVIGNASDVPGGEATISPISGPKGGGTAVTITTSLQASFIPPNVSVTIGGSTCTSQSTSISTGVLVITCNTAAHHYGIVDVVVSIPSLGLTYTIPNGYEYIETGDVKITNISYVSGVNVSGTPNPSIDANTGDIDFDLTFMGGLDNTSTLQATYRLTVTNSTDDDYTFTAPASNLTLRISPTEVRDITYSLSGIAVGDTIPANSSVSFNIILETDYVSGEHSAEGGIDVEPVNQKVPSILGSINGSNTGDLSGNNTLTSFQINVESTFEEQKSFTIESLSSDFEIVNSSGQPLGTQTIAAETTGTYTFYMKKASGAAFASETATAGIIISYDSTYTNVGEVNIKVDKDPSYVDAQAPVISGVSITRDNAVDGRAVLSWTGTDNVGVASYSIYRCQNNTCTSVATGISGLDSSYTLNNISDGTYNFVVVGFDDEGNTATQSQINSANTDPGPASGTGNVSLSWEYSITGNITNGSLVNNSGDTVRAGGTYRGTITPSSTDYNAPSSKSDVTVKVNGQTTTDFTYSSGVVEISGVTGDIEITATCPSGGCLIEGTMIAVLDENGRRTTKPIEDITYSDMLVVWNHETGTIGYVHPARIEKASVSPSYQLTTFSDGSTLGTVSWHGIFDIDANEFVSVDDFNKFGVGTRVYKVINDQLTPVTVTNIERIQRQVNIYYITSSTYYNIISDDFLTTNGYVITSNFYGFEGNVQWPSTRAEFIADPNNLYTYADFADIGIPLRMFNDLRLGEAAYLQRYGITLQMFKNYLVANRVIEDMVPYDDE
ncbi:hypothetical protein IJG89_01040 [Candidatus Saccharibacteria bacterium]|nr:hypothetical protein [Candidatus Saccharibacteria bacterium]